MATRAGSRDEGIPQVLRWWTPSSELTSLFVILIVTLPLTAALFGQVGVPVALSTALVATLFVRLARRTRNVYALFSYCFFGGGVAGWANAPLGFLGAVVLGGDPNMIPAVFFAAIFGFVGALWGVPYGLAYFVPLRVEQKYRNSELLEAPDRVMLVCGAWGVATLLLVALATSQWDLVLAGALRPLGPALPSLHLKAFWLVSVLGTLGMLGYGALRLVVRRLWVKSVRHRKAPGWVLCSAGQFPSRVVERLAPLSAEWWPRRKGERKPFVLARGHRKSAYRNEALEAAYIVY